MKSLKNILQEAKPGDIKDIELGRICRKAQKNPKWGDAVLHYVLIWASESDDPHLKGMVRQASKNADVAEKEIPSYYGKKGYPYSDKE